LTIGDNGTSAILSCDHHLLNLSSYKDGILRSIQGCFPGPHCEGIESARRLLYASQDDDYSASYNWGLFLDVPHCSITYRGFTEYKWPIRNATWSNNCSGDKLTRGLQITTSYVEKGRLIQLVTAASSTNELVSWRLEGKIQLLQHLFDFNSSRDCTDNAGSGYAIESSNEKPHELTVRCLNLPFSLNVQLFRVDSSSQTLQPLDMDSQKNAHLTDSPQPPAAHPSPTSESAQYADIIRTGKLNLQGQKCVILAAVLTVHDGHTSVISDDIDLSELRRRLGLARDRFAPARSASDSSLGTNNPLLTRLQQNDTFAQLDRSPFIPHSIIRNLEYLLSVAKLPESEEPPKFYLPQSFIYPDVLHISPKSSL
jgi:hypothetical protein